MEPFVAEIMTFAGNFAPTNWLPCDGRLMSIRDNTALFSLIGTTYGGDGRETFGLPTLKAPVEGAMMCIAVNGVFPSRP